MSATLPVERVRADLLEVGDMVWTHNEFRPVEAIKHLGVGPGGHSLTVTFSCPEGYATVLRPEAHMLREPVARESEILDGRWKIGETVSVQGAEGCQDPRCSRIGGQCVGYHCPYCGEPCSMMGHQCEARSRALAEREGQGNA